MNKIILLHIFILFFQLSNFSRDKVIDSLKIELNKTLVDTTKCTILYKLVELTGDDEWPIYNQKLFDECNLKLEGKLSVKETNFYLKNLASTYNNFGYLYAIKGDDKLALDNYFKAKNIQKKLNEQSELAVTYNNIASSYKNLGRIMEALEFYYMSLKIKEKLKLFESVSASYHNIGGIYLDQGELEKAFDNFKKCLKYELKFNNLGGIAASYFNFGNYYFKKKEFDQALTYYNKTLKINQEINNESGVAEALIGIGSVYQSKKEIKQAMDSYNQSLNIISKIGDRKKYVIVLNKIALLNYQLGNLTKAFDFSMENIQIAKEFGYPEYIKNSSKILYNIYKDRKESKKALEMFELYNQMKDSLDNEEIRKSSFKQQYKYEYENKETILKAKQERKNLVFASESKRQKTIIIAIVIGLVVIVIFLIFVYNRYKITQKQKNIIFLKEQETQKQKEIVDQKNKEILASITYAKRIQSAILPHPKLVKEYFNDSFILYKPKDIVAGDFYWLEVIDDLIFFAAADCTGHGVPGAMVSVVCNNALNRSVKEFGIKDPGEILNKTREIVVMEFEKSDENVKDGMDISLCVLNKSTNTLFWAGAHNPLWILRKNEIHEYKADKQPIGKYFDSKSFNTHQIQLEKEDILYIFTDGYADQFGGSLETKLMGKKFKSSQFKFLLQKISEKSMEEQKNLIDNAFEKWKGTLEQVDDVCVIGVRI